MMWFLISETLYWELDLTHIPLYVTHTHCMSFHFTHNQWLSFAHSLPSEDLEQRLISQVMNLFVRLSVPEWAPLRFYRHLKLLMSKTELSTHRAPASSALFLAFPQRQTIPHPVCHPSQNSGHRFGLLHSFPLST